MRRRLLILTFAAPVWTWAQARRTLRGILRVPAVLVSGEGETRLEGDKQTTLVLGDRRLDGKEFEIVGEALPGGGLRVDPIHTKALKVLEGGKALLVTYWCEVCSIRTYAPGPCMCCQADTDLDLREKLD
jgi:hypothetical protein